MRCARPVQAIRPPPCPLHSMLIGLAAAIKLFASWIIFVENLVNLLGDGFELVGDPKVTLEVLATILVTL